jgi:hypothetical protein
MLDDDDRDPAGHTLTTEDDHCPACHGVDCHATWCTLAGSEEWSEP